MHIPDTQLILIYIGHINSVYPIFHHWSVDINLEALDMQYHHYDMLTLSINGNNISGFIIIY